MDSQHQPDDFLDVINTHASGDAQQLHDFYLYEPWDVPLRPDWVVELANKDGVDLRGGEIGRVVGPDPHPFQTGYHMSTKQVRSLVAGSRVGKSWSALCEDIICLTGEIPYSMRHPAGVDTGVPRRITDANILRWGRWRKGELLDFDPTIDRDGTWGCGNIIGVGMFPKEKILRPGEEVWLGTPLKALQSYWQRKLDPTDMQCLIPSHFFDTSRVKSGVERVQGTLSVVHLLRGTRLRVITYETGYNRFEAGQSTRRITLDEEPSDQRIWAASIVRADFVSLVMTPYNGITYTREHVFPKRRSANSETFHACQYDSPYRDAKKVHSDSEMLQDWERAARVWGAYSEQRGKPYYDRSKINIWIQRYKMPYERVIFSASQEFFGVVKRPEITHLPGLMDVKPLKLTIQDDEQAMDVWKMYEDVKDNVAYVLTCDTSAGDEDQENQKDVSAAGIARLDEDRPVIVASTRTKRPVIEFAQHTLVAARYYNNALIAAESAKRGATNATYYHETKDWPYWFHMAVMNDQSRRTSSIAGFDTNSKTRDMIFSLIREHMDSFSANEYPLIPDEELLKELAACVSGKNGRPDHTSDGTLDSAVWFGILLYVWKYARDQVQFNGTPEVRVSKQRMIMDRWKQKEAPPSYLRVPAALERR
jgi:hypothetical protein